MVLFILCLRLLALAICQLSIVLPLNVDNLKGRAEYATRKGPGDQNGLLFHVAPMQCYTNRHLRYFFRLLSEKAVLWTEMEKTDDLLMSNSAGKRCILFHDNCYF
jgi:hypothetical protein